MRLVVFCIVGLVVLFAGLSPGQHAGLLSGFQIRQAHAQRGQNYVHRENPQAEREPANRGFPGLFDTEMLRKGQSSGDLPLVSIDIGLTDNFNVGTYMLFSLPAVSGIPSALVKARYQIFRNAKLSVVANGFIGGYYNYNAEDDGQLRSLFIYLGSINSEYRLDPKNSFGANFAFGSGASVVIDGDFPAGLGIGGAFLTLRYQHNFSKRFAFEAMGLVSPYAFADAQTVSAEAVIDLGGGLSKLPERLGLRLLGHWRPSDKWLFQFGGMVLHFGDDFLPIPWLSIGRHFK